MADKAVDKVTLSNGHDFWFAMYGDADALNSYILVHGAAGTHEDFEYLSPLLVRENFNAIAVDLPGSGLTPSRAAGGNKLTEDLVVEAMCDFVGILASRDPCRRFYFVGHSFGGWTLIQVAARGKFVSLVGLCLINSSGFRPHVAVRPFWFNHFLYQLLVLSSVTRFVMADVVHFVSIKFIGFSPNLTKKDAVSMFHRGATMDYKGMKDCAAFINNAKIPVLHASALNDKLLEKAIGDEICAVLKPDVKIEFDRGGHKIQKTKAPELAEAIVEWATSIMKSQPNEIRSRL
ncbi:unnamed protein product [Aphanomyces euteiches]|uniref:AB hydrolase-1 domain-containing protein n=1 Tax=Aphanomyces euteiches TaxID=100861 RepID=A0A6G0XCR6_9STRA|nr:hypothetical protein Ae201684_005951 [Aphanomyces euteiches]KAH9068623.1 hypothetical protein Ae201684P_004325 [Aphanomyces euteiches]KAH9137579.1 hypothetical protein AeRB84_017781 [Aphanomyces euteiches]